MVVIYEIDGSKLKQQEIESSRKCTINWKNFLNTRFPVTSWLPLYTVGLLGQDILAGFTVGLTEIPQAIAFAVIAGLQPQYGLYSGLLDAVVYFIFGTCKDINIGPTSILALMIQPHVTALGPDMAVLVTFLSGCIIFMLGLLHLGFLVEFFSYPVIAGFTTAAALQIASSQLKSLLGIPGKANEFLEAWTTIISNFHQVRLWDCVLGISSIIILMAMKKMAAYGSRNSHDEWSTCRNIFAKIVWLLSLARNAIIVIIGTLIAWIFWSHGIEPFKLTGDIGKGLPTFQPPPFSTEFNNQTYDFVDMIKQYDTSLIFIPLVAILEHVAISKAFAKGKTIDATQELIALGLCNLSGSFVRSMPVTGSFTRTAVNNASGVRTPLGGLVVSIMVLMSLVFLTSTFYFIPKATLAAVVICAMFYLMEFHAIITLWRTKRIDLIPFMVTLIAALFLGLEYGILIGIGSNLVFILYSSARPSISIEKRNISEIDVFTVTPYCSLEFPSAEFLKETIIRKCDYPSTIVVIDGKYVGNIDATVAKNFKTLTDILTSRRQNIIFWNFKSTITKICLGVDSNLAEYFKEGSLQDIVDATIASDILTVLI